MNGKQFDMHHCRNIIIQKTIKNVITKVLIAVRINKFFNNFQISNSRFFKKNKKISIYLIWKFLNTYLFLILFYRKTIR